MGDIHNNAFIFFHKFSQYISGLGDHTSSICNVIVKTPDEIIIHPLKDCV